MRISVNLRPWLQCLNSGRSEMFIEKFQTIRFNSVGVTYFKVFMLKLTYNCYSFYHIPSLKGFEYDFEILLL